LRDSPIIGANAEQFAINWLKRSGFTIIAHNFRGRWGEIDIIGTKLCTIVFCEVKYRKSSRYGSSAASVSRKKQGKLAMTAQQFLSQHPEYSNCTKRFDVIALGDQRRWIEGAFSVEDLILS
jgi:putative endonuclease